MSIELLRQLSPPGGWLTPPNIRMQPLDSSTASLGQRLLIRTIEQVGKLDAANLWLLLMHNTRLLRGVLSFVPKLMPFGELPRRDTELVILRVAWNCRSRYEWAQHVDIGLREGLTYEEIIGVSQGPEAPNWGHRDATLLRAADELHANDMVSDSTWQALMSHFDKRLLLELLLLIGFYKGLAGLLNSTGLAVDRKAQQYLATEVYEDPS